MGGIRDRRGHNQNLNGDGRFAVTPREPHLPPDPQPGESPGLHSRADDDDGTASSSTIAGQWEAFQTFLFTRDRDPVATVDFNQHPGIADIANDTGLPTNAAAALYAGLLRERCHEPEPTRTATALQLLPARAAQTAVVNKALADGILTRLDPPGSHADRYTREPDGRPAVVWYASYGSNLTRDDRFMFYLRGGIPTGSTKEHHGTRDTSDPTGDISIAMPGSLFFAGTSLVWQGGGIAFYDPSGAGHTLSRAYRVTAEQFDDIAYQENGGNPHEDPTTVDTSTAVVRGHVDGPGKYGRLVHVGDYDNAPVFTFTSSFAAADAFRGDLTVTPENTIEHASSRRIERRHQAVRSVWHGFWSRLRRTPEQPAPARDWDVVINPPSPKYLRMISSGLHELGFTPQQATTYLDGTTQR